MTINEEPTTEHRYDGSDPNVEGLEFVLDYISKHPDEWDQSQWVCGTRYCFAGHAVITYAGMPVLDEYEALVHVSPDQAAKYGITEGREAVWYAANRVLRLAPWQASFLFAGSNDLDSLRTIVDQIISGALKEPRPDCTCGRMSCTICGDPPF